jgi:tripeptidyl-peptidase-1
MRLSFAVLLAFAHAAISKPLAARWNDMAVKHAWEVVPNGWISQGAAPADHKMVSADPATHVIQGLTKYQSFRIGLKQDKMDDLITSLHEVSDPAHARYGQVRPSSRSHGSQELICRILQHLSKEDVDALVAPHTDTVDALHAWLAHHDIPQEACHRSDAGDWVSLTLSVEQAERMLGMLVICIRS